MRHTVDSFLVTPQLRTESTAFRFNVRTFDQPSFYSPFATGRINPSIFSRTSCPMTRLDHHPKKPGKLGRAVPLLDSSNSPLILQKIRKPLASPRIFDPLFSLFAFSPRYTPIDLTSGEQFTNEGRKIRKPALPRPPPRSTGTIRPREPSLSLSSVCLQAFHAAEFLQLPCYGTRRPLASFHLASFCAQKLDRPTTFSHDPSGGKEKKTLATDDFTDARQRGTKPPPPPRGSSSSLRRKTYRKVSKREGEREYVCVYACYVYVYVCVCVCRVCG